MVPHSDVDIYTDILVDVCSLKGPLLPVSSNTPLLTYLSA